MDLSNIINLQLIIFLLMIVGMILRKINMIKPEGRKCLTDLLINVILPCNIICSFQMELTSEILSATLIVLIIALVIQLACYVLGKVLYMRASEGQKKVLQYATMCSNAGFMGNPIIEGIYGAQGLLYASVYLIPLRFFMWSAGLSCFTKTTMKDTLKKLAVHPCIIAVEIGFVLLSTQLSLPDFLGKSLKYVSNCTLPVSIIVIGTILAEVNKKDIFKLQGFYFCLIRLLVIPGVTLLFCRFFQIDQLVTGVCVVLAGMPAGSTTAILAEKYGGDAKYASSCIFLSTLLSLITIPFLYWIV